MVFIISSPLQALACWLILKDDNFVKNSNIIVFTEGYYSLPKDLDIKQIKIRNTRNAKKNISHNIEVILLNISSKCELWVSELSWPMNNAIYSTLLANKKINSVSFFDEGTVMYFNSSHTSFRFIREFIKSLILKLYFKHYKLPSKNAFTECKKNGRIAAFNPELIEDSINVEKILINPLAVSEFTNYFFKEKHNIEISSINNSKDAVLVLSQPYYRVFQGEKYSAILTGLKQYLNTRSVGEIFIKLHPSESLEDYKKYYHHLGFKLIFSDLQFIPAEIILSQLNTSIKVVSFGTSAFINAKKFGFFGEMIVYGLSHIVQYSVPFQVQKHRSSLTNLYEKSGCNMVDHNVK